MSKAKNILFLSIEDLNDWVEPLGGHPQTITPNITRLANRGVLFKNAYAAAPACSPSRTATLFSRYPWETGVYANQQKYHDYFSISGEDSLVGHFKSAGFQTWGAGKVFHVTRTMFNDDMWTAFNNIEMDQHPKLSAVAKLGTMGGNTDFGAVTDAEILYDDENTDWMMDKLKAGSTGQFWSLGLYRPHLPFIVPQRFFDMFPDVVDNPPGLGLNSFDPQSKSAHQGLPMPAKRIAKRSAALGDALHETGEYNHFLKSYLASIAYADHLLGKVLDKMDAEGLWDNTLVILWSDHGWQLGEKLAFRKFSLWERALKIPLIFAGAGVDAGTICDAPVSLVDIAPTICSVAGQDIPPQYSGTDLTPYLHGKAPLQAPYAASIWGKALMKQEAEFAFSVRSQNFRHTIYWNGAEELYDHRNDPYEHINLMRSEHNLTASEIDAVRQFTLSVFPEDFRKPANL